MRRRWETVTKNPNYQVSNLGEVRNKKTKRNLLAVDNGSGYRQVILGKEKEHYLVHRLVAEAFLKNTANKKFVIFKDGDKTNMCSKNLKWSDTLWGPERVATPFNNPRKAVMKMSMNEKVLKTYPSITVASYEVTGTKHATSSISKVCQGEAHTAYGYKWRYA